MKPLRLLFYRSLLVAVMCLVLSDTRSLADNDKPTNADIAKALTGNLNAGANMRVLIRFEVKKSEVTVSGGSQVWSLLLLTEFQIAQRWSSYIH